MKYCHHLWLLAVCHLQCDPHFLSGSLGWPLSPSPLRIDWHPPTSVTSRAIVSCRSSSPADSPSELTNPAPPISLTTRPERNDSPLPHVDWKLTQFIFLLTMFWGSQLPHANVYIQRSLWNSSRLHLWPVPCVHRALSWTPAMSPARQVPSRLCICACWSLV